MRSKTVMFFSRHKRQIGRDGLEAAIPCAAIGGPAVSFSATVWLRQLQYFELTLSVHFDAIEVVAVFACGPLVVSKKLLRMCICKECCFGPSLPV